MTNHRAPGQGACQFQYKNLRDASSSTGPIILHWTLWYLQNRGLLYTLERGSSRASSRISRIQWLRKKVTARDKNREYYEVLNLQPGELVEVKSEKEIRETLDRKGKNRGLEFMPEMRKYCGKRFKVYKRLGKIILESTGEIRRIRNTVLLDGVVCDGSEHLNCDRSCFHYWREAWLERVNEQK